MTHWAIVAPGNIAHRFAEALASIPNASLYGVTGRSVERSAAFAQKFDIPKVFTNIQELLADPMVDVVYIASPHQAHASQSLDCLNAGKAVLCEKPMTVNARQARQIIDVAQQNQVFFMEAVWTRFLPIYSQIRRWLDSGKIGEVRLVQANFGIKPTIDNSHRLLNPELAGGSILDLGIYPLTLADWVYQETPRQIQASGHLGETGVDEQMAATLRYSGDRLAQIYSAVNLHTSATATIFGTEGQIEIQPPFLGSETATLHLLNPNESPVTITLPHAVNGYVYEAEEVQRCLAQGLMQSLTMPWQSSIRMMEIMDELRAQLGVRYPFES